MSSKRNAYYFYMVEYKDRLKQETGKEISLSEASLAASDSWKAMTDDEKSKYKELADESKQLPWHHRRKVKKVRSCCKPKNPLILLEEQKQLANSFAMTSQVKHWLVSKLVDADITGLVFNVVHFNMFYENIPAEVGLVKFSLEKGLVNAMNNLICVKKLPLGATYEANKLATETHGLSLPPKSVGEGNLSYIWSKIKKFCSSEFSEDKLMIFCRPEDTERVKAGLAYLSDTSEVEFIVSDFVELMRQVINMTSKDESVTYEECLRNVNQDPFETLVKGCDVHDELDRNSFCSLSIVKRLVFQLINAGSKYLKLDLIPGVHLPDREIF